MKMKKLLPLLLAAALLNTGCSSDEVSSAASDVTEEGAGSVVIDTIETADAPATAEAPAIDEAPATTEASAADTIEAAVTETTETKTVFEAGTWMLYEVQDEESIPVGYCFMSEDGMSGNNILFEDGEGYSFEYEIGINEINVTVDGTETIVPIVGGDPAYVMLDIPDCGRVDMVYLSDITQADIPEFYSNEELGLMAQEYYTILNGSTPQGIGTESTADNMVLIHLYDNMEDHIATCAWYKVDRWSTAGTDEIMLNEINLLDTLTRQAE